MALASPVRARDPAADDAVARLLRALEVGVVGIVVVLLTGALVGPLLDPDQVETPVLRLMWLPIYGVMLLLAVCRARQLARFILPAMLAVLLIGWAFATRFWSIDPSVTGRRVIALSMCTLFGLYLAAAFPGRRLVEMLGATFLLMALGSIAVCLLDPSLGLHHDVNAGAWRGLWYEKNQMGAMMVVGAVTALCAARAAPPGRRLPWLAALALSAGPLLLTHSATSALCLGLAIALAALLTGMRQGPAAAVVTAWGAVVTAIGAAAVMLVKPEVVLVALGKDATLTGRTDIWAAVMRQLSQHPWLGFGYAAFWGRQSPPALVIRKQTGWLVPSAHNGWLDLLVQIGIVGGALYGVVFLVGLLSAAVRTRRLRDGDFTFIYLCIFGVVTLSESLIILHNNISWVLFVACLARALGPAPADVAPRRWTKAAAAA